jgi:hypothetical protein
VDCIQKSGVALGNTHVVDITTNAINRFHAVEKTNVNRDSFCIGSAGEKSNGDTMIGLQKEWENDSQETNKHNKNTQSWNRCSHNGTESGSHALFMDTQVKRIETVTQQKRMDEVQEKKATSSHCSKEMQQTELMPKVGINNKTTNKLHCQQTQECIQSAEMCVETEQKKGRKMENERGGSS